MTRWNPNDPSVVGPEFFGVSEGADQVLGLTAQIIQGFRSNAAETIGNLRLHHGSTVAGGFGSVYLAEIVAVGDELPDGFTDETFNPNVLTVEDGTVTDYTGGPVAVGDIDDWPPDYANGVRMISRSAFSLQFATAAFVQTGRIASVGIELVTPYGHAPSASGTDPQRRTVVWFVNGGTTYGQQTRIIPNNNDAGTAGRLIVNWGEINPITNLPWTEQDIQDLDTATTVIELNRGLGDAGYWYLEAARLVVIQETSERREAVAAIPVAGATVPAWSTDAALIQPDGTANWAKADATDYSLIVRLADRGGLLGFGPDVLDWTRVVAAAGETNPADLPGYVADVGNETPFVDESVSVTVVAATALDEVAGTLHPFVLRTTAPATSGDGQPYVEVRTPGVFATAGATEQELTPGGTDLYAGLRIAVGWFVGIPADDLVVEVRRRSDNTLMGTFTITTEDLTAAGPPLPGELVIVETKAPAPGISLTSGVQYYLDISSATAVGDAIWLVGLLAVEGGAGGVTYEEATFAGGTDRADPIGGQAATAVTFTPADVVAVIDAAVDTPSNWVASAELLALPDDQPCPLDGIPYALLAWDVTALGADFAYYQIERLGPDGVTWELIAQITDETVDNFQDQEGRLDETEVYRLRVVRTDGASSYWTDEATVTLAAAGCGYTFTSNEAPELAVGYPDIYQGRPIRGYRFPEADEVQFRIMYGRDFQVAFRPLSRRGVTFERQLVIGGLAAPAAGVGPPAADAIRDLAWATTSYVCVRDQHGNRVYGNLRVSDLEAENYLDVTHIHRVNVGVVELTASPSVVDAST